jgi:DNA-directed RNA polymerase subunit beta
MAGTKISERINFGKIKEVIAPPNLIEVQLDSYREFLQAMLRHETAKSRSSSRVHRGFSN